MSKNENTMFIYTDSNKCMGCHSCEIACSSVHSEYDLHSSLLLEKKVYQSRNTVIKVGNATTVVQCVSCDAPCIESCPIDVIQRHDNLGGLVKIDEEECIGCKACAKACPYDLIKMVEAILSPEETIKAQQKKKKRKKLKALKCDLCFDQISADGKYNSACINACPTQAIVLTNDEALRSKAIELTKYYK